MKGSTIKTNTAGAAQIVNPYATWDLENRLGRREGVYICGIDECGRGAWSSNMVVGAAVYHPDVELPFQIKDSKAYRYHEERERIVMELTRDFIEKGLLHVAYAEVTPAVIEANNLNDLNLQLFKEAALKLPRVERAIIDGSIRDENFPFPGFTTPNADKSSISVATASIFAKVYRDRQMLELHKQYPQYGFNAHMGYGTKAHADAIRKYGPIPGIHRKNFLRNLRLEGIPA